ncbi:hypothetical protein [Saccharicrinis sp. FJH54]|uniref:hypothetical protein n=1 Tax=Saccharicrinis sp. FJH54 TaxID=3344665 RepID=UPI0035D4A1FC
MKSLKYIIPSLFDEESLDRVDYYIEKINESLKTTNKLFVTNSSLILLSIVAYHLIITGNLSEINILGQKLINLDFIKTWFLLIPSLLICITSFIGYLRVYQKETIEWLLAKHRKKEFDSEIFRLTLPPSYILGLDLIRRQENSLIKMITIIPTFIFGFITIIAPIIYINYNYIELLSNTAGNAQVLISYLISCILILCGMTVIFISQKI